MRNLPLRLARPLASAIVVVALGMAGCGQGGTVAVAGGKDKEPAATPAKTGKNAARADALRKLEDSPEVKKHAKLR